MNPIETFLATVAGSVLGTLVALLIFRAFGRMR